MKKFTALLLAACLALQPYAGSVYGASASAVEAQQAQTGILEIHIAASMQFPYEGSVSIEVSNGSGTQRGSELSFAQKVSEEASFELPAGEYTVTVKAKKFADYVQPVRVQAGRTSRISVSALRTGSGNGAKAGWLRAGDIDGDGDIDKADSEMLLSAIRENRTESQYDLNHNGWADLADLNALVQGMDETQLSAVEMLCFPTEIQAADGTLIEGSAGSFLQGKGGITLKTKNGAVISQNSPVEYTLTMPGGSEGALLGGMVIYTPAAMDETGNVSGQVTEGSVVVVSAQADGRETTQELPFRTAAQALAAIKPSSSGASVKIEPDGSVVVDFGGQTAVKRVTIKITGTTKNQPLVEISKVEFVNNMADRIAPPQLDIPSILSVTPGNKQLSVTWNAQNNVTGYELSVSGPVDSQGTAETQIAGTTGTQYTISSINNKKMLNFKEYTIKVRSANGSWRSPWSEPKIGTPAPQGKPAPPDNVKLQGGYRSMSVTWKNMDDAEGYMVYYKESTESAFRPAVNGFVQQPQGTGMLTSNSYTISGLKDYTSYQAYVVGWNETGWGSASATAQAMTKSDALPLLPKYKLLNTSNGTGQRTNHIVDASFGGSGGAGMSASPLDSGKSAFGLVDDDYGSYWAKNDWDDGVSYPGSDKGMEITLDADYKINYFTFASLDQKTGCNLARIEYWNTGFSGSAKTVGARLLEKMDKNDNPYYIVKFDETITANRIRLYLGRSWADRSQMKVGEIHFHQYDSLEDEIMGLYTDDMHTTLRTDVTKSVIQALERRLETADAVSGEKHPLYKELSIELKTAGEILNSSLAPVYTVYHEITAQKDKDANLGFGGLNAWQPLGRTAYAGETLLVFVGHNTKRTNDAANLQLVYTQHHAEAASVSRTVNLKVGRNMLTVPQLSTIDAERGGQLYIAYTGNNPADKYGVRIGGGTSIPVLDVYKKTGNARTQAIQTYIGKLESYLDSVRAEHDKKHKGNKNADYAYDEKNCILNATDILMGQMMYSLPAAQILAGLGTQGIDAKTAKLEQALTAMEQMMALFYQHKGLSGNAGDVRGKNALPACHLNIRYMRMFAGAFMYAAGNHIGIEWDSARLSGAQQMSSFGWGIAHEIGHNINQGTYAIAEITNNYFAQLLKSAGGGGTRFSYENVYKKVTSGTAGRAANVFTQLGLYWQLHLAFDDQKDDGHMYGSYEDQFKNLFFARVDTYSRNPDKAPQAGLALNGGAEQNLMRLSCAAANQNILPFFERWGMEPDAATKEYAEKYGKPVEKALYYVNDSARDYRVDYPQKAGHTILNQNVVKKPAVVCAKGTNQVTITMDTDVTDKSVILGYEIVRSMYSDGRRQSQTVGFQLVNKDTAQPTVFTDTVHAVNNRVLYYEVRAVDQFLNYSQKAQADPVKIETGGRLDKSNWTVETTMVSDDDKPLAKDKEDPDSGYNADKPADVAQQAAGSISRIIDGSDAEGFTYKEASGGFTAATITLDMHRQEAVTSLIYEGDPISSIMIEASTDGKNWQTVKETCAELQNASKGREQTVWFQAVKKEERAQWIGTYDARYIKLTLGKSSPAVIQEISLCGPTGDNVWFLTGNEASGGKNAVGILEKDWRYGDKDADVIKSGALIFTGKYKGNSAYNVVVLYDEQGNVIGAKDGKTEAGQVILADVPETGKLGDTYDGTWVYYVEAGQWDKSSIVKGRVRAELYRVDAAHTNGGERIVSDTQFMDIDYGKLPSITLTGNAGGKS